MKHLLPTEAWAWLQDQTAQRTAQGLEPLTVSVGLESGEALVGSFGAASRRVHTVLGQVVSVGPSRSRALLIADNTHAMSVRVERTGLSAVAEGIGQSDALRLIHLPHSTDIREGDRLLTSGLDGRFPEGYPVAKVVRISQDASQPFMVVYAEPYAQLDRVRHVLLLSKPDAAEAAAAELP